MATEDDVLLVACARHPNVQTALRCGRCETPICPQCLVMTPVGARCPTCSPTLRNPIYSPTPGQYLRAIGAGLAVATIGGLVAPVIPFFAYFGILLVGAATGEVVSRAANRKRGRGLAAVAVITTVIGIALGILLLAQGTLPAGVPISARLAIALPAVLGQLLSLFGLFVLLAAVIAASRLR